VVTIDGPAPDVRVELLSRPTNHPEVKKAAIDADRAYGHRVLRIALL
jgi:hypothetical protein